MRYLSTGVKFTAQRIGEAMETLDAYVGWFKSQAGFKATMQLAPLYYRSGLSTRTIELRSHKEEFSRRPVYGATLLEAEGLFQDVTDKEMSP